MCGIAGYVNFDGSPVSYNNLKKMTDAIFHRGPDGEGHWYESNVGLGHRRLAIIDLSNRAQQPMTSFTNRYIITYNGEVYNFRDIRRVLEKKELGQRVPSWVYRLLCESTHPGHQSAERVSRRHR